MSDWYLDAEGENAPGDRIYGPNFRGWTRSRDTIDGYRVVRLLWKEDSFAQIIQRVIVQEDYSLSQ